MSLLFSQEEVTEMYVREREQAAMEQGRTEGFASGQKEGFSNGRREGKKETAIETAEKMLRKSMPEDLIAELSSLSLSEIEKIKEQMETESSH